MKFYLGTHRPGWVDGNIDIPFFISCRCVLDRKKPLLGSWMLDSAGFTEIMKYGKYEITEDKYISCIERLNPEVAFCQDWMCEDIILEKTRKTVKEHQLLTTLSYLALSKRSDKIRPVLQGFHPEEYITHLNMYKLMGVDMTQLFGVGSICKRNSNPDAIFEVLSSINEEHPGIKLHGFGLKITSLKEKRIIDLLYSADSMAWSFGGRHTHLGCEGCTVQSCANCFKYAEMWYNNILNQKVIEEYQLKLWS